MERKSEVVILMATYNGANYLPVQLDSIVQQTFSDWTLLISDDGSSDGTQDILNDYATHYPEKIVLLKKDKATGSAKNNFIFLTAYAQEYSYIMYCDQDDYWKPNKIQLTLEKMKKLEAANKKVPCLVHTDLEVVDEELNLLNKSFMEYSGLNPKRCRLNQLLIQNNVTGCTMMINHALWSLAARTVNADQVLMHDWWFALIAAACGKIGFMPCATIQYRQHRDNSVGAKNGHGARMVVSGIKKGNENRHRLKASMVQAGVLLQTFSDCLTEPQKTLIQVYADGVQKGKWYRVKISFQYGIWKNSFIKRIAQIWYD